MLKQALANDTSALLAYVRRLEGERDGLVRAVLEAMSTPAVVSLIAALPAEEKEA